MKINNEETKTIKPIILPDETFCSPLDNPVFEFQYLSKIIEVLVCRCMIYIINLEKKTFSVTTKDKMKEKKLQVE